MEYALLSQAPEAYDVDREFSVQLDRRNRPEPDVLVYRAEAETGPQQTWHHSDAVILAIEVVSEDSAVRDREVKPRKYAAAGIPYFWRVEQSEGEALPVVYTYELDRSTNTYSVTGIHHERLEVTVPFPITIELTALNRRPPVAPPSGPQA